MKRVRSDVPDHLVVREAIFLMGSLQQGAQVRAGVTFFVNGNVKGRLDVERDARVVVLGEFSAVVSRNLGRLVVAGALQTPVATLDGSVAVAPGSLVPLAAGFGELTPDGSVETLSGAGVRWDSAAVCALDTGRFLPAEDDETLAEFWRQSVVWR